MPKPSLLVINNLQEKHLISKTLEKDKAIKQ